MALRFLSRTLEKQAKNKKHFFWKPCCLWVWACEWNKEECPSLLRAKHCFPRMTKLLTNNFPLLCLPVYLSLFTNTLAFHTCVLPGIPKHNKGRNWGEITQSILGPRLSFLKDIFFLFDMSIFFKKSSWWDGIYHHTWKPEFNPQGPHDERRELRSSKLSSVPHKNHSDTQRHHARTHTTYTPHMHTHATNKCIYVTSLSFDKGTSTWFRVFFISPFTSLSGVSLGQECSFQIRTNS